MPEPLGGGGVSGSVGSDDLQVSSPSLSSLLVPHSPLHFLLPLPSFSFHLIFSPFLRSPAFLLFFFFLCFGFFFFLSLKGSSPNLEWDLDRLGPGRV